MGIAAREGDKKTIPADST